MRLRVRGSGAQGALDNVLTRATRPRAGRVYTALLLRDDGGILADLLIVGEPGGALLLAEGASVEEVIGCIRHHQPVGSRVELSDLALSHAMLTIEGPFAWELLGELAESEAFAAPFHTAFQIEAHNCVAIRAGIAGEYAYHLLVAREHESGLRARLAELAPRFELQVIEPAARALAALEQGSFTMGLGAADALTPFELQLQWRIDYKLGVPGISAVRALRNDGKAGRITWWVAPQDAAPSSGSAVTFGGREVGSVIHAQHSPVLECAVGLALLERAVAHPDLRMQCDCGPLHTVAPPLLNNRSLFVHPHRHSFARRHEGSYPPLSRIKLETAS